MKLQLTIDAEQDLIDAYQFYESQKSGLGDYFLNSLNADIESLSSYAGIHQIFFDKYYKQKSSRFPFAIYYTLKNDTILVEAILDSRRKPSWIKDQLG